MRWVNVLPAFGRERRAGRLRAKKIKSFYCLLRLHSDIHKTYTWNGHALQAWSISPQKTKQKEKKTYKFCITTYFSIRNHRIHTPLHHSRDMRPPPPWDIIGGAKHSLSEPACGLRPCASLPKKQPSTQRIPSTQKDYLDPHTFLAPHFSATVGSLFLPKEKMCVRNNTVHGVTATHSIILHILSLCFTRRPKSAQEPAWTFPFPLPQTISPSPKFHN
jgi:hypothetical protein